VLESGRECAESDGWKDILLSPEFQHMDSDRVDALLHFVLPNSAYTNRHRTTRLSTSSQRRHTLPGESSGRTVLGLTWIDTGVFGGK
jgi:hypothetical protein